MNIQTIHTKNLRWIDITDPGPNEIEWLKKNYHFHELHYQAVAEHQQRPRIDQDNQYHFLVLLFPVYHKPTQEIIPGEVDFFIGNGFLVTAHYGQINTLKQLFNQIRTNSQARTEHMRRDSGFLLYKVLEALFRRSYPILDHISEDVQALEKNIFSQLDIDMLSKIALMKKNVIEFRKMMKTHRSVLEKLPKSKTEYLLFSQSRMYYKDLLEYSGNIWDILEALKETLDTLADANQSLATYRLNQVSKRISIFSAIVIPATLVAFLFGVGVEFLPFRHHPNGFWIILILMLLSSLILLLIFKKKKWF